MGIIQIISIGIIATILSLTVGKQDSTWSFYIRFATSLIFIFFIISQLSGIFDTASNLGKRANVDGPYISIIFKIIGISYISEFGAGLCKDAGETAIASKIEFAGKIMILTTSAPIILALMDLITTMLV